MPADSAAPAKDRSLADAIADYRRSPSRLGLYDLLRPFVAACYQVAGAHDRGAAHLGLTPHCILLGDYDTTTVAGWGRPPAGGLGADAAYAAGFLAPEQARGEAAKVGPSSDVYALGAVLYALLTGEPPYIGDTPDVLARVREGLAWQPRMLAASVPAGLEGICLTAMERDPADRYRSAAELAREVERWLAGEPVRTNYVEPQPVRLLRWARTNRGLAVMAALIVVSLGALAVAVNVIRVERQDVREQAHEADEEVKARLHRDQDLLNEVIGQRRHASEELGTALQALRAMALKSQPAPGDGPTLAAYKADLRQTALNGARRVAGRVELARGSDLAAAHDRLELGALFEVLGQPDEAQWQYQRAVQIAQGRAREEPDNLEAKRGLVLATRTLGQLCLQRGQAVFARSLARQALPAAEACTKAEPNNLAAKHEEALCLRLLANADEALHDLPAARGDFDKLIVAVEGYASADPNNLGGRIELANAYAGRGQVERLDYRFDEALNWYDRALAILQPLDKDGKLKPFPQEVARLKELKQTAGECRSSLKAVEDINYALTEPDYRAAGLLMSRAGALARRGRVADAAATAEKLRELKPHDGTNLYNVARALALCATGTDDKAARAEYTRRAVEALRAAAGHGFHDLKKIESEPDLDVLRADPGYRAFVAREVWLTFPVLP